MTNSDAIARLVAALEAGPTPGPWIVEDDAILAEQRAPSWVQPIVADLLDEANTNGPFIAAAREGVPALLAQVRELEVEIAQWRAAQEMDMTPKEFLASHLIDVWVADKGCKIPWIKAVQISAIVTGMPDVERDRLLAFDDLAASGTGGEK